VSGAVVWFTGLPASGKTTLAERTRAALARSGRFACLLDGDAMREALVPAHGYDPAGRDAFYETLARIAALLARQGLVVLVSATAHRRVHRDRARSLAPRFVEVYLATPAEDCAARDPKGLWAAAREGRLPAFPGTGEAFETPARPDVVARGGEDLFAVEEVVALATTRK
jgi:adenylylsulfate kinase